MKDLKKIEDIGPFKEGTDYVSYSTCDANHGPSGAELL